MKKLILFITIITLASACSEDCVVPHVSYEWNGVIEGENRKAIIWKPNNDCYQAPVLFYFHGRGGEAKDSEEKRKFHEKMKGAYIVYAEGTNFDSNPNGKFGWETRFPHIKTACSKDKDIKYVQAILDHLGQDEKVDLNRVGAAGHSSGGFFTLSLAELMTDDFVGFASLGSYTSYNPKRELMECDNTYRSGIKKSEADEANAEIKLNPAPTLFMFGTQDSTLHGNVATVYKANCNKFSYFQNSVKQLCIKNGSETPDCEEDEYMTTFTRQYFKDTGGNTAETQVQVYDGNHSWPAAANDWVVAYFTDLLYY